ncbi:MAG: ribosome maturation factor RimM [Nitrospiraceae bacterium]|nr:ribosome maturation factor RimM [Nitrospiraceae bacterium]
MSLAHILRAWGVRGEVKALPLSKLFDLVEPGSEVTVIHDGGASRVMTIRTIRRMPKEVALSFQGIDDRDEAALLRNSVIAIPKNMLPALPEGEYLVDDVQGITVRTTAGTVVGVIEEVLTTGSNDVYVVRDRGREYLIPAIRDVIKQIDIKGRTMTIDPMDGLLEPQ